MSDLVTTSLNSGWSPDRMRAEFEARVAALTSRAEAAEAQVAALRQLLEQAVGQLRLWPSGDAFTKDSHQISAMIERDIASLPASPATEKLQARAEVEVPIALLDLCIDVIEETQKHFQASANFADDIALALGQLRACRAASALKGEG